MSSVAPRIIGRYMLCGDIAAGGMATVHYGRLLGPAGFSRTVAIKRLHAQFARDAEFVSMFMDEARLAARIRHPNVVQTVDIVALEGELFLVMDFVLGEALSRLLRASLTRGQRVPLDVVSSLACGVLHGLHAAHEATAHTGEPLGIVHRDVSPQNVLVGVDGIPRVLDFGIAKAAGRIATTREGQLKGKFAYMASEQVASGQVDRRTDVYATGVVLWEMLTLQRLFTAENDAQLIHKVIQGKVEAPSALAAGIPPSLDAIVLRSLATDPAARFDDARQMALAIEAAVPVASPTRVAGWVDGLAGEVLKDRARLVARIESNSSGPHQALEDMLRESLTPTPAPAPQHELLAPQMSSEPKSGLSLSQSNAFLPAGTPAAAPRSHGLRVTALALTAVGGIALAGSLALTRSHGSTDAASSQAAQPQASPEPAPTAPRETSSAAAASHEMAEGAAPLVASSGAPSASSAVPARPPPPRPPTKQAKGPPAASDPGHCTIKSFVDESGIEHFVKECN